MICIICPSSFILTAYLAFVAKQEFSTWISNLVAGSQQLILLILCLIFKIIELFSKKKIEKQNDNNDLIVNLEVI
jgi:hypothetical protein